MKQLENNYYVTPEEYLIAESHGISRDLVNKRIRNYLWNKEKAITVSPAPISKYGNIKYRLKENGIDESTFYKRIAYGWTIERASTEPINLRKDIINKMANARRNIHG